MEKNAYTLTLTYISRASELAKENGSIIHVVEVLVEDVGVDEAGGQDRIGTPTELLRDT